MVELVVDASLVVEVLVGDSDPGLLANASAPSHMRLEAASALRAMQRHGRLPKPDAESLFGFLEQIPVHTWDVTALLPTAWELRDEFSLYDGLYVAMAIHLRTPLATVDRRLARAAARYCAVYQAD